MLGPRHIFVGRCSALTVARLGLASTVASPSCVDVRRHASGGGRADPEYVRPSLFVVDLQKHITSASIGGNITGPMRKPGETVNGPYAEPHATSPCARGSKGAIATRTAAEEVRRVQGIDGDPWSGSSQGAGRQYPQVQG